MRLSSWLSCVLLAALHPAVAVAQRIDALSPQAVVSARPPADPPRREGRLALNGCPAGKLAVAAGGGAVIGLMLAATFPWLIHELLPPIESSRGDVAALAIAGAVLATILAVSNGSEC